jgi:hypothetical protein
MREVLAVVLDTMVAHKEAVERLHLVKEMLVAYLIHPKTMAGAGVGAGAAGSAGGSGVGGNGGNGSASSISGSSVTYAGGGGGGVAGVPGTRSTGGTGGGGAGGINVSTQAVAGTANLGGGGGGMPSSTYGAAGGSGVVIISYAGSQVFGWWNSHIFWWQHYSHIYF